MEISVVAVVGAGSAGRRIAQAAAIGAFHTILVDILPASLRQAQSEMEHHLAESLNLGQLSLDSARAAFERLKLSGSVADAAREADLVIEAVPDELESKLEIFILLDKIARPGTILASTTSSLSVSEIASVTYRRPKILGMRFFFTGASDSRVEIVRAADTDDATIAACVEAAQKMSKQVVVTTP